MTEISPGAPGRGVPRAPAQPPGPVPVGYKAADDWGPPPTPTPIAVPDSFVGEPQFSVPSTKSHAGKWFLYALIGFLVGQILGGVFGQIAGAVAGKTAAQMKVITSASIPPEWYIVSTLVGLWVGFVGAPWLASYRHGTRRFFSDLGVRFQLIDLVGIGIGIGAQLAIGLLYLPFRHDIHNFNGPSQKLTGGAHGIGILVIILATGVAAPMAEELFFRGLLFKSLVRLFAPHGDGTTRARGVGIVSAVIVDGLLFGLAHAEWVQLAGLALFGMLLAGIAYRTGRLGMNMVAHASFNTMAVLVVLGQRGGVH
jgi:membrane protease YdiL (CAAX protease family)